MNQNPYPTDDHRNGQAYQSPEPAATPTPGLTSEERTAAILAHLSAIIAFILSAGALSLVGPFVVWFVYKDRSPMVREAAAGAFNFNLAAWVWYWIGWLCVMTVIGLPIAIIIWIVVGIAQLWCHIRGAMAASDGRPYRYPFQIPVLK